MAIALSETTVLARAGKLLACELALGRMHLGG